jgi:hypothetical protein
MKKVLGILLALVILFAASFATYKYYGYIFSKTVTGKILKVDRVSQPQAIIANGSAIPASQMFSFAVAIRDDKGEIHTASSEDRQWAVAQEGQCVEAKFFPYAPWELDQAGTFHNARLIRLFDCP